MSEFENLMDKLLEQKSELTKEDIEEQIKQKKEKIGAGYLTDQGALFLIASDYGITLSEPLKIEMELKDLYAGAKEISLETRVLNLSPAKQFSRKDGTPFYLRTMTVYDANTTASVKLWDEKANLPGIENLKPGDLIKIIKAYVKSDLDGSPTINIGSGSNIEPVNTESEIPTIDTITKDISELEEGQKDLVISGIIDGIISGMEFTNSRGKPGKALRMRLKGKDGSAMRVVLWGKDESSIPNMISQSAKVRLLGVKVRSGNQGLEIHGNDATIVEIEGGKQTEPVIVRVLSMLTTDNGKKMILAVDNKKNLYNISDLTNSTSICVEGDVIECMPSKIYGNSITLDENSFVRKLDNDESIPSLSQLRTKINDVKVDGNYCIESIILKVPERREVQTKSGESIALSEMFVEDDTGSIWVKGWRNQARIIDKCELGEIVSITGLNAKAGLEGRIELFLTVFSKIIKKN
ncbi:single-stranded DNA-binding protein [Marine Group I thaumarchaeote]|uniref:Single-stranded DNA-binding protein n=1 Tax=Marine Group I thaumarchaeote TaxID=2511932 RepID=A0A7K4P6J7_9ARCH|nr:single-stranded DNA-binding protein [Candidatus Nitrosopumilus sp. MTA1]NWJ20511.1 single-stranded DNA-binding protein [Marine Group I thaumarchaeote]NWJ28683.1 single-stranded DNA-binding protein [Marine Group I thaumarchaeote]NWJ56582.1 single-stranded DNA-binding protein [Marine Group I thaumarchaeote]NWK01532.1 single-stranded DNA-binding protein [Marine Group I thaumarchaeote]